jgi:hypothetical protein
VKIKTIFKTTITVSGSLISLISLLTLFNSCCEIICPTEPPGNSLFIIVPDDFTNIHQAVNSLSLQENGGTIYIKAGTYILSKSIHVNFSNVTITGEQGTLIKLDDNINQPVFLLGSEEIIPETAIQNIQIMNLEIDGNKDNQNSEYDATRYDAIRNNGIDVRMVSKLWVSNVDIHNTISGGIVISWHSSHVFITNSSFHYNRFDGIALYTSENIQVNNFSCYANEAAGLSLDNQLKEVIFSNGIIEDNLKPGIFVRDSEDISFFNLIIKNNGQHDHIHFEDGCYLSHDNSITDRSSGVTRLFFNGCSFIDNKRNGIWLDSPASQSPGNSVIGCLFSGNGEEAIKIHPDGELFQDSNVFQ